MSQEQNTIYKADGTNNRKRFHHVAMEAKYCWNYIKQRLRVRVTFKISVFLLSAARGACLVNKDLRVPIFWEGTVSLTKAWGRDPCSCFSATACAATPHRRPHLVSPFPEVWTPGVQGRGGRRFLGTRLTCSTVGVCVPGFLVKHQGALGSDHPHERRDFAGRRETLDIFSTASLLLCWRPSDCFRVLKYKINVETTKWLCF